ncbi:MAG: sugar ABC transporter permease [Cereibacter sphaeroides]|uniref:Sugar ABC transporter permease n=1 Tax=Cereibacter sphaeroides TaxID=1063 RepID=A0A2W5S4L3_CERSP|nr:MAG: sugar ABC transporter permease [Cereibacter sphaeroides]
MLTSSKERTAGAAMQAFSSVKGATGPLIGLVLLCLFLTFGTDTFFATRNFLNILDQITVLGIMAVGMTMVILIGGIDLAVGSVMALAMMVLGYLNIELGLPMGVAIPLALIAAAANGVVAGLLITRFNVPPFIATLAMMSISRGIANMISNGQQLTGFPTWFNPLAIVRYGGFLTVTVAVMLVIFVLGFLFLRYSSGGRALYAIGGNPEVARLAGINVKRATMLVYVVCSFLAGLAGMLIAARLDSVQPSSGMSYELDAIAAVVIGGTSLSGGTGGVGGTIIGVLIIGVLRNGLNLLSVSPFVQQVIIGLVILLAVVAETYRKRG